MADADGGKSAAQDNAAPVVRLRIKVLVVLGLTVVLVGGVAAIMLTMMNGVDIGTPFDPTKTDQKEMLDKYNSATASIVSAVTQPVGRILAMMIPLSTLCFASQYTMAISPGIGTQVALGLVSFGVNYLFQNGFNALNVQPYEMPLQVVVMPTDLKMERINATSTATAAGETMPVTETVLRNLLMPVDPGSGQPQCTETSMPFDLRSIAIGATFGFSPTTWQSQLFPNGIPASASFNASLNETTFTESSTKMPMSLNIASRLVTHSVVFMNQLIVSDSVVPTPTQEPFKVSNHWQYNIDTTGASNIDWVPASKALFPGLIQSDVTMKDSAANQASFANISITMLRNGLTPSTLHDTAAGTVEFTHYDLLDGVVMDAITIDLPLKHDYYEANMTLAGQSQQLVAEYNLPSTSFVLDASAHCTPTGCYLSVNEATAVARNVYPDPIVQAVAECSDPDVLLGFMYDRCDYNCSTGQGSNNSMLIVSIAKRMQGDEMNMHSSSNASVSKVVELVNMRKYYTMTVSRFAWSTQDLAARYNAQCADTGGKCQGITAPLTKKSTNATDEVLLVGKNVLQGKDLPIYTYQFTTLWTPLIQWNQPVAFAHPSATDSMLPTYVDMILPRHFKKSTFNPTAVYDDTSKSYACNPVAELRMQFIETNKLYMEHPLQPTYTAAVFYLLQNGAVRKTMPLDGTNLTTLQLDNNKQRMALRASTPRINGIVTLAGCAIVAAVSLSILIGKGYFARRIRSQLAPHTVARVLLNGSAYPSAVMQCVVGPSNQMKPLKDFHVRDVVLTDKDNNSVTLKAAAVTKK